MKKRFAFVLACILLLICTFSYAEDDSDDESNGEVILFDDSELSLEPIEAISPIFPDQLGSVS